MANESISELLVLDLEAEGAHGSLELAGLDVRQTGSTCDKRADHWGPHPVKLDPSARAAPTHVSDPLSSCRPSKL